MSTPKRLEDLAGEELGGVHFVRNYVEFYFDGPIVRSLSDPILYIDGRAQPRFPEPGSRDALCCLIGRELQSVRVNGEESISLCFSGDAKVIIPLSEAAGKDPALVEAAHFVPGTNQGISVW